MQVVTVYYGYYVFKDEAGYFIGKNKKRYKHFKSVLNHIDKLTH